MAKTTDRTRPHPCLFSPQGPLDISCVLCRLLQKGGVLRVNGGEVAQESATLGALPETSSFQNSLASPGWCSSVDSAWACEPKGHQFHTRLGHMPGLWARSPAGRVRGATDRCISRTLMFLYLSFSLPPHLSKNKQTNKRTWQACELPPRGQE